MGIKVAVLLQLALITAAYAQGNWVDETQIEDQRRQHLEEKKQMDQQMRQLEDRRRNVDERLRELQKEIERSRQILSDIETELQSGLDEGPPTPTHQKSHIARQPAKADTPRALTAEEKKKREKLDAELTRIRERLHQDGRIKDAAAKSELPPETAAAFKEHAKNDAIERSDKERQKMLRGRLKDELAAMRSKLDEQKALQKERERSQDKPAQPVQEPAAPEEIDARDWR